ncbi:hypothetical protein GCM10010425_10470 [Streptomyces spororaveus]|uniref:Secreted protein n=1 Tax=Streptomyces spororaveus TaxID=284039 RepID=A0ABQ3TND7_9ACTN|nr:hypothetical protein Sspor_74440 [Streptomyces spororaveus]
MALNAFSCKVAVCFTQLQASTAGAAELVSPGGPAETAGKRRGTLRNAGKTVEPWNTVERMSHDTEGGGR